MTRKENIENLLTEIIEMIDNGSQKDLDRADKIATIIKALVQKPKTDMPDKISIEIEQAKAIPIPDNATNKDVFKAVFGYEPATDAVVCNKADWCGASEPCNYCMSNPDNIGIEEDWWNAPYMSEVSE